MVAGDRDCVDLIELIDYAVLEFAMILALPRDSSRWRPAAPRVSWTPGTWPRSLRAPLWPVVCSGTGVRRFCRLVPTFVFALPVVDYAPVLGVVFGVIRGHPSFWVDSGVCPELTPASG